VAISAPEPLDHTHDASAFSCGKPALDEWLRHRALQNQQRGFTAVQVVHEEKRILGYYGLAPSAVAPTSLPRAIRTGQPPNPIPCLLLGQLAVDQAWAGQGIGLALISHALARAVQASRLIAGRALIVKAIDGEAAEFWVRRGFQPTKDDPLTLARSLADIAAAIQAAGVASGGS
jgi:GNAT superfamily N-acetyltransferase